MSYQEREMKGTKVRMWHANLLIIASLAILVSSRLDYLLGKKDIFGLHLQDTSKEEAPKDELDTILERASMGNKTVILSVVNKAYTNQGGLLDLFLESLRTGDNTSVYIKHLVLIAVDQKSYDICKIRHPHCYNLNPDAETFSKELVFMSTGYLNMLWRKTLFIIEVLKRGYSFLFTDVDLLWLRDPFEEIKQVGRGDDDFQMSCDMYSGYPYGEQNAANIGFYFVVSNNKTIAMYESLYANRNNTAGGKIKIQQHMLMEMKRNGLFYRLGLKMRYLDVAHFGGVCSNGRNFTHIRTIHTNCCRGIKNKLSYLNLVFTEWKGYKNGSLTDNFEVVEEQSVCRIMGSEIKKALATHPCTSCLSIFQKVQHLVSAQV